VRREAQNYHPTWQKREKNIGAGTEETRFKSSGSKSLLVTVVEREGGEKKTKEGQEKESAPPAHQRKGDSDDPGSAKENREKKSHRSTRKENKREGKLRSGGRKRRGLSTHESKPTNLNY